MGQVTQGSQRRIQTLVPRISRDETTFAIVTVRQTADVKTARQLVSRIQAAVTAWMQNTPEGKDALDETCHDYNVGDLANDLGEPSLSRYLEAQGLLEVEIEIYSDEDYQDNWSYDTRLFQAGRLDRAADALIDSGR